MARKAFTVIPVSNSAVVTNKTHCSCRVKRCIQAIYCELRLKTTVDFFTARLGALAQNFSAMFFTVMRQSEKCSAVFRIPKVSKEKPHPSP